MALTRASRVTKAVAKLLEEGAENSIELALAAINLADEMRAENKGYMVVQQYGEGRTVWYRGVGPFQTARKAQDALSAMPELSLASATAIVPTVSPAGAQSLLEAVDAKPKPSGDWLLVKKDAEKKGKG